MKNTIPSTVKRLCQLSLKFGSAVFLLFFTIFSPAAPAIAQIGSAVFILLLIILSPFTGEKAKVILSPETEEAQRIYCQLDNDQIGQESVMLQSSSQQSIKLPILPAETPAAAKIPQLQHIPPGIILYLEKKTEQYYTICQPVRAGPATFFA